jgi:hypothetical protein
MPEQIVAYHEGQAALVEFHMRDEQRVYVDSRLEVMTRPAMENYYRLADSIWRGDEIRRQMLPLPTTILVDHASHFALEPTLLSDPDWICAWFGPVAAVYVPKAAAGAPRDPSGDLAARHFGRTKVERTDSAARRGLRGGLDADLLEAYEGRDRSSRAAPAGGPHRARFDRPASSGGRPNRRRRGSSNVCRSHHAPRGLADSRIHRSGESPVSAAALSGASVE